MYFHISKTASLREKDIIGIFDMENTTITVKSRKFLEKSEERGEVIVSTEDLPKSYIVCEKFKTKQKSVYLSPFSSQTLIKRTQISEE